MTRMAPPDLDSLMAAFGALPDAEVGDGPAVEEDGPARLDAFLDEVPGLTRDAGYVEFLRRWSGAYAQDPDADHIVDVFGFSGVSTDLDDMVAPVRPDQPYVVFAQCIYRKVGRDGRPDVAEYSFGFANGPDAPPGVHLLVQSVAGVARPWHTHAPGFTAWLADLVDREGWYEPRGAPSGR